MNMFWFKVGNCTHRQNKSTINPNIIMAFKYDT